MCHSIFDCVILSEAKDLVRSGYALARSREILQD